MPNIRTFDTPALDIRPTEVGVEATAAAARRGGAFYNQASQALDTLGQRAGSAIRDAGDAAVKWHAQREISAGAPNFEQQQNSYIKAWNSLVSRPDFDANDPTIAAQFRASMEPGFDQFRNSFLTDVGRNWAENRIDRFREHMFAKTNADMAKASADQIELNLNKVGDLATNTVYNDPGIESLKFHLNVLDDFLGDITATSPNITPDQASRIRNDLFEKQKARLISASVTGSIAKGADEGAWRKIVQDPEYSPYVDATEIHKFERQEKAQKTAERTNDNYNKAIAKQERQEQSDDRQREIMESLHTNPRAVSAVQALNDFKLTPTAQRTMAKYIDSFTKGGPPEAQSRAHYRDIIERIARPEGDPEHLQNMDDLNEAWINKEVKVRQYDELVKEFQAVQTPGGRALLQAKIEMFDNINRNDPYSMWERPQQQTSRFYDYIQDINRKIEIARAAGQDPMDLFNPSHPSYAGHNPRYLSTQSQQLDLATRPKPKPADAAIPPKKENEGPMEWLTRFLGGKGEAKPAAPPTIVPPAPPVVRSE